MIGSWSLKAKLISLCVGLAVFSGIVGGLAYSTLQGVTKNYDHVADVNLKNIELVGQMRGAFLETRAAIRAVGLEGVPSDVIKTQLEHVKKATESWEVAEKEYLEVPFVEGEQKLFDKIQAKWDEYGALVEKMRGLVALGDAESRKQFVAILLSDERKIADEVKADLGHLDEFQVKEAEKWKGQAQEVGDQGQLFSAIVAVAAFLVSVLIGFLFSNSLVKRLKEVAASLDNGAREVAHASKQISEAGSELSASATEQAAALQETVASIDEISAMVQKNSDNATRSQSSAHASGDVVNKGKQVINEVLSSIEAINSSNSDIMTQTESSNQEIASIVKVISEIGNKTKVINDIVFQTKLLSFNASVEAARAGEHGKGFAVVAEEVGSLAQMSGNAAKEISELLEASISKVENTVNDTRTKIERLMTKSKERIDVGLSTAKRCGDMFDEIVGSVHEVTGMVSEIATASKEQALGVQEINKAMGQMDQVTQQNASAAQQSASAAEQLTAQASLLKSMVDTLLSTVDGVKRLQAQEAAVFNREAPARASAAKELKSDNVVSITKKAPKAPAPVAAATSESRAPVLKKAVGAEGIPSENDPRFEDI